MTTKAKTRFNRHGAARQRGAPMRRKSVGEVRYTDEERAAMVAAFMAKGGKVQKFQPTKAKLEFSVAHIPEPDWEEVVDY